MCFFELNYGHINQDLRTFVAKTHQSQFSRFWGKILNPNFYLCKKIDIMKLWISTKLAKKLKNPQQSFGSLISLALHSFPVSVLSTP